MLERIENRTILRVTGKDRVEFLQNLVTNDVRGIDRGIVYAALLTPQGKYLADFFLVPAGDAILLDVASSLAHGLDIGGSNWRNGVCATAPRRPL